MMKLHPPVRGSAAWQFGEYELRRLLVWLWPTLSLLAIRFGAALLGMLSSSGGWGDVAAGVLTLVGKFVWETLKNNRSNVAHRGVKIAILLCCASAACAAATAATPIPQSPPPLVLEDPAVTHVVVCFSPHGGAEKTYCDAIRSAKKSVHAYAYSFTSGPISDELVAAQARGVDVQIIVDPSGVKGTGSRGKACAKGGVTVFVDHAHAIMHQKVLIVDAKRVATGSFNFSIQAETRNSENAIVLDSKPLAAAYEANWEMHREHSDQRKMK
jgi:phosphatidylserine/phosphatidylglycerophosphate/cardiolipin synthase-like enzyme